MNSITFLFLLVFSFFSSESVSDKISWSETNKLTWADFRGKHVVGADYVASTSSGISFSYSFRTLNDSVDYKYSVESNFYPEESWYNPMYASKYILKHEQAHFDISELHARILRKNISEASFSLNIKNEIEIVYQNVEKQRREMQDRFDLETDHSKNTKNELTWEAFIAKQLNVYERWK